MSIEDIRQAYRLLKEHHYQQAKEAGFPCDYIVDAQTANIINKMEFAFGVEYLNQAHETMEKDE